MTEHDQTENLATAHETLEAPSETTRRTKKPMTAKAPTLVMQSTPATPVNAASQSATTLIDILHRANQVVNLRFSSAIGEDGPTPRQLAVLASIAAKDGLSQTDISDATGIDRATTAEIVGRLTRLGLVKRRRTRQDARTYAVSLTEKGEAVCSDARRTSARVEGELLQLLPSSDRAALIELLSRLVTASSAEGA